MESLTPVPPPWTLKGDFYTFVCQIPPPLASGFPQQAFSPLEASSEFSRSSVSRPVGGLGVVMIIRYHESPVGPYDELALIPGKFEWLEKPLNGPPLESRDYKISRIYVSQKQTCYNGRVNWNIPKHLARFDWFQEPNKSITVKVYPHDTGVDATESQPSPVPFFIASMKTIPYVPSFPFSTSWLRYTGMSLRTVQPPLPQGSGGQEEIAGTKTWRMLTPCVTGQKSDLITFDWSQHDRECSSDDCSKSFWPQLRGRSLGVRMLNATMFIGTPERTW